MTPTPRLAVRCPLITRSIRRVKMPQFVEMKAPLSKQATHSVAGLKIQMAPELFIRRATPQLLQ